MAGAFWHLQQALRNDLSSRIADWGFVSKATIKLDLFVARVERSLNRPMSEGTCIGVQASGRRFTVEPSPRPSAGTDGVGGSSVQWSRTTAEWRPPRDEACAAVFAAKHSGDAIVPEGSNVIL